MKKVGARCLAQPRHGSLNSSKLRHPPSCTSRRSLAYAEESRAPSGRGPGARSLRRRFSSSSGREWLAKKGGENNSGGNYPP